MGQVRQRTDSIHDTIYLSAFETMLTSTPFFYRLHDIYQSSTVYLTFTSNHTKRYEHSMGAMALASEMLFSGITNADSKVRTEFFRRLDREFQNLYRGFFGGKINKKFPYLEGYTSPIKKMIKNGNFEPAPEETFEDDVDARIDECTKKVLSEGLISDDALNRFSLYSLCNDNSREDDSEHSLSAAREQFLYQCLLQALRTSALFHDVGHPPYSHIIEDALTELYERSQAGSKRPFKPQCSSKRIDLFQKSLKKFIGKTEGDTNTFSDAWFFSTDGKTPEHLHEAAGIYLLEKTVKSVMQTIVKSIVNKTDQDKEDSCAKGIIEILYYITSIEFAGAILLEAGSFFMSIHRIIDGTIDADRLDYVPRDSHGSGVDWGEIHYRRLIDPAKLFQIDPKDGTNDLDGTSDLFVIAYPERVISDIEDFLLNRYRVFTRINFHHRCVRTSMALASCVKGLIIDYLENSSKSSTMKTIDEEIGEEKLKYFDSKLAKLVNEAKRRKREPLIFTGCISPDIHILWSALDNTNGDEALKVLQWNDSWMISILQSALLRISTEKHFENRHILQAMCKAWNTQEFSSEWERKTTEGKKEYLRGIAEEKKNQLEELKKNLEEFLLNKKSYYSLFKRGIDMQNFVIDILGYAGLNKEEIRRRWLEEQLSYSSEISKNSEQLKMTECLEEGNTTGDTLDAKNRYGALLQAFNLGDLKALATIFPTEDDSINDIMQEVLDEEKKKGKIAEYKIKINDGWDKTGLPKPGSDVTKDIYLYREEALIPYDVNRVLKPQISALQHGMPWIYVYIRPTKDEEDIVTLSDALRKNCAQKIGAKVNERYNELFPGHKIEPSDKSTG